MQVPQEPDAQVLVMDFVYDDGGRAAAGYKGTTSDCVVRAIAIALQKPYQEVYDEINIESSRERPRKNGKRSGARTGVFRTTYDRYLLRHGWVFRPTMGIGTGCKVHLRAGELPSGTIITRLSKHVCAVVNGVVHDLNDPSREGTRCVYGYYEKP